MDLIPKMNKNIYRAIVFGLLFIISLNIAYSVSIGVSPGRVNFENLLKGGYAERVITISTNSDEELIAHFEVGGDVAPWLRFEPNTTTISFSKFEPYKLKIIVEPPGDVINGSYSGSISYVTDRFGSISGRAGGLVKAAVTQTLNLVVINDEISVCKVGAFDLKDVEIGYPIEFGFLVSNGGNVRVRPSFTLDVWDQMQENMLLSKELVGDEVLPTVERMISRKISHKLDVGQYWATASVEGCGGSNLLTFNIVEKGGIADKGVLNRLSHQTWAYVYDPLQISAEFQNQGQRAVFARFKGDIKLDEKIIEVIETDELEVPAGETNNFDFYFTPERSGRYVISGKVIYNKKFTFEKVSILNINPAPEVEEESIFARVLPLAIYILIVITIFFIVRKIILEKKKRRIF